MPRQQIPVIRINDTIRTQLQDININSVRRQNLHDRWIALDAQGVPFVDGYRIVTSGTRNALFTKLREILEPRIIPSTEQSVTTHDFSTMIFVPTDLIEQYNNRLINSRYIDGLALRVGPISEQLRRRIYVPFMFQVPWEIPVVLPIEDVNLGWASRRRQKIYLKHMNTCKLAANEIIEEMIRLGTIRVGLTGALLLNQQNGVN